MGDTSSNTSELTAAVKALLRAHGGYCWRNNNQPRRLGGKSVFVDKASIGTPDLIAAMPGGVTLWVEVKITPDKLRESQKVFRQAMIDRDHIYVVVVDTLDALREVLEQLQTLTPEDVSVLSGSR